MPTIAASTRLDLPPRPNMPASLQTACCRWLPTRYFEGCARRLGDRFTLYTLDMPPLVFLSQQDDIRAVITGDPTILHPGPGAELISPLVGNRSFMLLDEDEHVCGRRVITPAFHKRTLSQQGALIADMTEREVHAWPQNTVLRLDPLLRALTLRIILRAIFGHNLDSAPHLYERLRQMLPVTLSLILQEPKTRHLPGWHRTWHVFLRRRTEVNAMLYQIINERRQEDQSSEPDLLDMLLSAQRPDGSAMSNREIRDNLMSMILAGHETTTGELAWAFQLLAHHQPTQQCLASEICSDVEDQYLTSTINETMRRKPVFLFAIPRQVVRTVAIGDWTYHPPAHLVPFTYGMHHNPELYRDPYEFRPERFLEEPPHPRTWLPWGGGRKHCLGHHFAMFEMKTILRQVLATRVVVPAARHIERPRWRSAIVVPPRRLPGDPA